jgi:hypothetical protein
VKNRLAVGLVVPVVAAAVIGAAAVVRMATGGEPSGPPPEPVEPVQAPASHDPDYWTDERIREATPAPMPTVPP